MKTYKVFLIRHGLTESNLTGRYIGSTDEKIIPEGMDMLRAMAEKYNYPAADAYYSSPMTRCVQTLEALYPDEHPVIVPNLAECNLGDFEGKTAAELKDDPDYIKWTTSSEADAAPRDGESNAQFATRVCTAFNSVVQNMLREGKTSAVVCTHGGVIMTLLSVYGLPQRPMSEWNCMSGKGYCIQITPSMWMRGGMFEVVGQIPFLKDNEDD